MSTLLSLLLSGLSIGSILTIIVKHYFEQKSLKKGLYYQEKKDCYLGVLTALNRAAIEPSDKHSKDFAYQQAIANLFGSDDVQKWIQEMIDTNDPADRERRNIAFKSLLSSMKEDLSKYI